MCFSSNSLSCSRPEWGSVFPLVVAGTGYAEQPAGHRDVDTVGGEFVDQPERYFGRMFSLAKYAAARFRISFSISS
jgi:hypothetical protein